MAPLFLVLVLATASQAAPPSAPPADWTGVAPGVELRTFPLADKPAAGDGLLTVVRIDPGTARLDLALASEEPGGPRTAGAWADARKFVVVINAGMYQTDHRTNVGYLRHGKQVHQKSWRPSYQSALVFGPSEPGLPAAAILDRDEAGFDQRVAKYRSVVQNLRLVKGPRGAGANAGRGTSVWKPNGRMWSEALVAEDGQGRILFAFSRTPYEMADLGAKVLALPLGVLRAMHVEGGPEASLSLRAKGLVLDLAGSYETGFREDDTNAGQWPIPNVLGVR